MLVVCLVACVGRKEANGVVAPVIIKLLTLIMAVGAELVKFKDGHKFNGIDAELFKVGDLFPYSRKGAGMFDSRRLVAGKAPDVHFVNNKFLEGDRRGLKIAPVPVVENYPCLVCRVGSVLAPFALTGYSLGVRVEDDLAAVKYKSLFRVVGTVKGIRVFNFVYFKSEDNDGVCIAYPVRIRERYPRKRHLLSRMKKQKRAGSGVERTYGKVNSAANRHSSICIVVTRSDFKTANSVGRI